MTDEEHARKFASESISLAISMYNPKAEDIAFFACLYGLTYKNDEIKELKQENAELKEHIKADCIDCADYIKNQKLEKRDKILTKAKEIIKELLSWEERADYDYAEYNMIKDKAEQFLKEIEK